MNTEIRVDTERLHSHIEILRREYQYSLELEKSLSSVQALAEDVLQGQFMPIIYRADQRAQSCKLRIQGIEEVCDIFERASYEISTLLNDYIVANDPERFE